jgi:outer membrane protein TolC
MRICSARIFFGTAALALMASATVVAGNTSAAPTAEPPTAQADTVALDDLVREAVAKNPAIQSAERKAEALRHRVPQVKALPDPVVTVGWAGNVVPFEVQNGDPSSYRGLSAMQQIPLGGKLGLRGKVAAREGDAAAWESEITRRRVVAEVKTAYYEYFYLHTALGITRKNHALLEKLARIAEVRYQVGKGVQADVLRAHVELSRLRQRMTVLEQQQNTARARLNTLLFRDPEAALGAPAAVQTTSLNQTLEQLYELAAANDAELQRQQKLVEREQVTVALARKDYVPDLSVGWMYQQRPGLPDMHGATFSLNLPIFYKSKQRERVKEAQLELESTARGRDDRRTNLAFEVKEQYLTARASEELVKLYSQGVVPQSSLALESSMASYEVGTVDFLTVITNFITVLDYETEYYREVANLRIAMARLEPLVGVELTN